MLEAVRTGSGEGARTGRSSRRRILRLPAAWWRCGIGFTRNLLGLGPGGLGSRIHCAANSGRFRVFSPRLRSSGLGPRLVKDSYADPELKSSRRYSNLSASEVLEALIAKGYVRETLPSERPLRDILNRMNYRLKRIQKGKPLKKTPQTDAIFANVKQVRQQARNEPETLEISMDTKAKVSLGDYVRGGKNPDRQCR